MSRHVILVLVGLSVALCARASEPKIFLSSHAPYGLGRADSVIVWTAADSGRADTLFLTFDPGRACSTFVGMSGTLSFHALGGDTLSALWAPPAPQTAPPWIRIEFGLGTQWVPPFPWQTFGLGISPYVRPSPIQAMFKLLYAVGAQGPATVADGQPYSFARVIFRRPPPGAHGRAQPVCIEWQEAHFAYSLKEDVTVTEGARYVGLNPPPGSQGCVVPSAPAAQPNSRVWKPPRTK